MFKKNEIIKRRFLKMFSVGVLRLFEGFFVMKVVLKVLGSYSRSL